MAVPVDSTGEPNESPNSSTPSISKVPEGYDAILLSDNMHQCVRKKNIALGISVVAIASIGILLILLIYFPVKNENNEPTTEAEPYGFDKNVPGLRNRTGCGGIIKIPTSKLEDSLSYKENSNYEPNENCLWTIENTDNSIRCQLTLRVELISHGFKGNTGLFAFKFNRDDGLASEKLTSGKEHELSAEGLYLSFTSDKKRAAGGKGFLLRITVVQNQLKAHGSNLFFNHSAGRYTAFSHDALDQISIAINAKAPVTFDITKPYSNENNELRIYEIQAIGKFEEKGRLDDGAIRKSLSFPTTNPILLLFVSDQGSNNQRFKFSWVENENVEIITTIHPIPETAADPATTHFWRLVPIAVLLILAIVAIHIYRAEFKKENGTSNTPQKILKPKPDNVSTKESLGLLHEKKLPIFRTENEMKAAVSM